MAKTGTTQLQNTLMLSRDALLESGILYPDPFPRNNNHRILLAGHIPFPKLPRHMRKYGVSNDDLVKGKADFLTRLASARQELNPRTTILSSESFFSFGTGHVLDGMRLDLERVGIQEIKVIAYVRRPSAFYVSITQQTIRASHRIRRPKSPDYKKRLGTYLASFGRERLEVRKFDRQALFGADIVTDFFENFLPEFPIERITRSLVANETLSGESLAILRRYRMDFCHQQNDIHTPDSTSLARELKLIDDRLSLGGPRLHESISEAIDYSSLDLLWLRDEFEIEFAELDYRRLEKRPSGSWFTKSISTAMEKLFEPQDLAEIIKLDKEKQSMIIDELRSSDWARVEEDRKKWVHTLTSKLIA